MLRPLQRLTLALFYVRLIVASSEALTLTYDGHDGHDGLGDKCLVEP